MNGTNLKTLCLLFNIVFVCVHVHTYSVILHGSDFNLMVLVNLMYMHNRPVGSKLKVGRPCQENLCLSDVCSRPFSCKGVHFIGLSEIPFNTIHKLYQMPGTLAKVCAIMHVV